MLVDRISTLSMLLRVQSGCPRVVDSYELQGTVPRKFVEYACGSAIKRVLSP